jgi:hypothetical protein
MLITLLIAVIVAGLIYWLLTMLPIPQPFKNVVMIIFIVICIIWLLGVSGIAGSHWGGGNWSHCP